MKIQCDGFEFDFTDALDVFVFDEQNQASPHYHGLSHAMLAVDLIVELPDCYLFVEVKDFYDPAFYQDGEHFNHLRETLKRKYRDTWLYRWAEGKTDKPIKFLCVLELETALISRMAKEVRKQLPVGRVGGRWISVISNGSAVLNFDLWNRRFTAWPVVRLGTGRSGST